jgi:lipopolysaccharide transport system ATP-binding protein
VKVKGRIASLLEVGTGFHPELTGRENIYLNGAILGMRKKEITRKFDEIVDFSGVERYIGTPVKRYSSGMYVRLAFAVAAYLESEILIVDEVLAVGDAEFQKKCLGKMGDISKGEGRTVLFVSHNMAAVKSLCVSGVLLENGKIVKEGSTSEVVQYYFNIGINKKEKPPIEKYRNYNIKESPVFIKDIYVKGAQYEIPTLPMNQTPIIVITIIAKQKIKNANISLVLFNAEGVKTDMAFSWDDNFYLNVDEGTHAIEFSQKHLSLPPGRYTIGVGLNQSYNTNAWDGINYYPIFEIENLNNVSHWDFRPWAVHHSQENNWKSTKI